MHYNLQTPLTKQICKQLCAGDTVSLSGTIYTARDAAHAKMAQLIKNGEKLPFEVKQSIIYYAGPTPNRPNTVVGSIGPTTSGRMDKFTPMLLNLGLSAMIGKGARNKEVISAMKENSAVYFAATGGAGALIAKSIISVKTICWPELGSEAVRELKVKDMPLFVAIDANGNNLYEIGPKDYLQNYCDDTMHNK